jgi:3-dehydroquinate dehydratase-2
VSGFLHIQVLHGPNLNLLGQRQPDLYGSATLEDVNRELAELALELDCTVSCAQRNSEGALVEAIQQALDEKAQGILINPAAYTHTSVAVRDALLAIALPVVEVHLTNPYARETFRHQSLISDIVVGRVMGFGGTSYLLGLRGLVAHLRPA